MASTGARRPRRSPRRARRPLWWVAVGVVVAAVATAGVVLLLRGPADPPAQVAVDDEDHDEAEQDGPPDGDDDPAADDGTEPGADPDAPAPNDEDTLGLPDGDWERLPTDDVFAVGRERPMVSVTEGGPGLVAVGYDSDRSSAVVWVSEQGRDWERIPHAEPVFGGDGPQLMDDVTAGGPGLVAAGTDDGSAAVWVSSDGRTWERVAHDEGVFGGEGRQDMKAVVAGGPGLVAVGRDRGRGSAAVWVSADGRTWERIDHDEEVFGGDGPQVMTGVATVDDTVVAVGDDRGTDGHAAVWVSEDGRDWERLDHDAEVFGGPGQQFMTAVTAGGPGLVAVGHDFGASTPTVWVSPDGRDWTRTVHEAAEIAGEGSGLMNAVAAGGPGLVAVGQDRETAAAWVSRDGEAWQRVAHDEAVFGGNGAQAMAAVSPGGPGMVAVGQDEAAGQAAVWLRE